MNSVIGMCDRKNSTTKQSHGRARSDAAGIFAMQCAPADFFRPVHRQAYFACKYECERRVLIWLPGPGEQLSSGVIFTDAARSLSSSI